MSAVLLLVAFCPFCLLSRTSRSLRGLPAHTYHVVSVTFRVQAGRRFSVWRLFIILHQCALFSRVYCPLEYTEVHYYDKDGCAEN